MLFEYKTGRRDKKTILLGAQARVKELVKQGNFVLQKPEVHLKANRILGHKNYGRTFLEERLGWGLTKRGIKFQSQYPILKGKDSWGRNSHYFLDFAIPEFKIAIEADGNFWHSNSDRDKKRQSYIENQGWKFLRFTEEEIKTNLDVCLNQVCTIIPVI